MPFHPINSLPTKYSSIEHQKIHEYEYKKFIKTLQINNNHFINSSESKLFKHRTIYLNNNYLIERQMNLQYRQDQRKHEYERIQKENLKFSQRLINAKPFLNRYEQQLFFDKHCKLKQRLQHYPDLIPNQTKKIDLQFLSNNYFQINNKPADSAFLIYNDNTRAQKTIQLRDKQSKDVLLNINKSQITSKKLPGSIKHHPPISTTLPPITSITPSTDLSPKTPEVSNIESHPSKNQSTLIPSPNLIQWNKSTPTENPKQSSSLSKSHPPKNILSSQSPSTSDSNLSHHLI